MRNRRGLAVAAAVLSSALVLAGCARDTGTPAAGGDAAATECARNPAPAAATAAPAAPAPARKVLRPNPFTVDPRRVVSCVTRKTRQEPVKVSKT